MNRIADIEARLAAATPGPWRWVADSGAIGLSTGGTLEHGEGVLVVHICAACFERGDECVGGSQADHDLIAHAPDDLRALLDVVKAAHALAASESGWRMVYSTDGGPVQDASSIGLRLADLDALRAALDRLDAA